jgi:hypothetical protein
MTEMTLEEARAFWNECDIVLNVTTCRDGEAKKKEAAMSARRSEALAAIDRAIEMERRLRDDGVFEKVSVSWSVPGNSTYTIFGKKIMTAYRRAILGEEQ